VPHAGVLDSDMLYRILIAPDRRFVRSAGEDVSLEGFLADLENVKNKYLSVLKPSEIRVTVDSDDQAHIRFLNFPGGSFSAVVPTNQSVTLQSPGGRPIKVSSAAGTMPSSMICPAFSDRSTMPRNSTTCRTRCPI
jgi:hypothetical protein